MNSYDFYVKNFPYIKYSIEKKYKLQTNNILLVIFYDNLLYKKYLSIKKECDFIKFLLNKFSETENIGECKHFNNEDYGVFIICGNLDQTIDIVINDIFGENNNLDKKQLESIGILDGMKDNSDFYITLLQINFFDSEGAMNFKFNELIRDYSNEQNDK